MLMHAICRSLVQHSVTQGAGIKTRAEGHDGTRGEGRGRPRVAATDDQEQGREEGGTREGNIDGTDTG